jgi:hypothetical protein
VYLYNVIKREREMSKASDKLRESSINRVNYLLATKMRNFENTLLGDSVAYEIKRLEERYESLSTSTDPSLNSGRTIRILRENLSRKNIITLGVMREVGTRYEAQVLRAATKIIDKGFDTLALRIEYTENLGGEIGFLLSNKTQECHARLIYVNGVEKAPHWRFITTIRTK